MYIVLWEYRVKLETREDFEKIYSSNGPWTTLFKKANGYLGTELLHDEVQPNRYLTIDRWDSKVDYDRFFRQWNKEYQELDAQCEGLTESEILVGKWNAI